jgi:hypothetical protein
MRIAALFVLSLMPLACTCAKSSGDSTGEPAPRASSTVPHVKLSDQPRLVGDAGLVRRPPDPEAVATGRKLADGVAKQCSDDRCRHEKCAPLCSRWMTEKEGASDKPVLGRQKRYFDCLGYCMYPYPDGGAK